MDNKKTIDDYVEYVGKFLISVFKKFKLKTHIECGFVTDKNEKFVLLFRTDEYHKKQQEKSCSDTQELISLLKTTTEYEVLQTFRDKVSKFE
jgi:hypothetical protein